MQGYDSRIFYVDDDGQDIHFNSITNLNVEYYDNFDQDELKGKVK
ncbi:hypothetical protein [Mucilaginibacter aurantiaciroseus]|nr:hypothetical protein [Mucilaginibacter aurantiaciroseus]